MVTMSLTTASQVRSQIRQASAQTRQWAMVGAWRSHSSAQAAHSVLQASTTVRRAPQSGALERDRMSAVARQMVAQERRQPGCLAFDIFEDVTTPNAFLMMEQWENEDVLDAHTNSEEFERGDAALNEFIVCEPSWDEYQF